MEGNNNEIANYSNETMVTTTTDKLCPSTDIVIPQEEMMEFLNCDEVVNITKGTIVEDKSLEDNLKDVCRDEPLKILFNLHGYDKIKKKYIGILADKINSRIPQETRFDKKMIEYAKNRLFNKPLITEEELDKAREKLSELADSLQSTEIDNLCMNVMQNPYRLDKVKLQNWLNLMLKNASERIFDNISTIIGNIDKDTNILEIYIDEYKKVQKADKKESVKNESKTILAKVQNTFGNIVEAGKNTGEKFLNTKRKEYIEIVLNNLKTFYKQIEKPDSVFNGNITTLGYLQTLLSTISEKKYEYISCLEDKKEELIKEIALHTHVDLNAAGGKDAYAKILDISINHLKENNSIKDVIDDLFQYGDVALIIAKAGIVLNTDKAKRIYPEFLVSTVAYHFIELSQNTERVKENERKSLKKALVDFILTTDDNDIKKGVFHSIIEKYSTEDKLIFIGMLIESEIADRTWNLIELHDIVLQNDKFTQAQRISSINILINNYKEMSPNDKDLTDNILLGIVCGEEQYHACKDIQQIKATEICENKEINYKKDRFIDKIAAKCKGNRELYGTLPEHIQTKFLESQEVSDEEKKKILNQLIDKARSEDATEQDKIDTKDRILAYCEKADGSDVRKFLDDLLDDYFGL